MPDIFGCEYHGNGDRKKTLLLPSNRKSCIGFLLAYLTLAILQLKVKVMHISAVNILKVVTDMKNYYCSQIGSHVMALDCHIAI